MNTSTHSALSMKFANALATPQVVGSSSAPGKNGSVIRKTLSTGRKRRSWLSSLIMRCFMMEASTVGMDPSGQLGCVSSAGGFFY